MKITFIKKITTLCFLMVFGFQSYISAQILVLDLPPGYNKVVFTDREKGIDGSPWLIDAWSPGTIHLKNGKIIEGLKFRYNVYRNQMYFRLETIAYEISEPDSIDMLIMDGKKFVYQNTDPLKQTKKRLTEVAVDGNAKLFINYYPDILPSNYNKALGTGNVNNILTIKQSFLIKVGSKLTVLDKKGKLFLVAFADKKPEIIAFIKNGNISGKKRSDVEKVVNYYNSLN